MKVVILKYNAGNTCSVAFALRRIGIRPRISRKKSVIERADRLIIPGVGSAGSAMDFLSRHRLCALLKDIQIPVLGICLGLHLLCAESREERTRCLGVFPDRVVRFQDSAKVPHMGWNRVYGMQGPLFADLPAGAFFYFVHSYFVPPNSRTVALCDYPGPFSAAVAWKNFTGLQFHPEKSGPAGRIVLKNFCRRWKNDRKP